MIPLPHEKWPEWLGVAYAEAVLPVAAVAEPPDEAGEADGVLFFVKQQLYNAVLFKADPGSVLEQWCFRSLAEALAALILWDGLPPGPRGWIRNFSRRGCWRQEPDTGEVWADGCRRMFAVKVNGAVLWRAPQAQGRELADLKARFYGGVVVEAFEHELDS